MRHKKEKILIDGEHYHIFNRGVDKRQIFNNKNDLYRFVQSLIEFNRQEPIGSIYENTFVKNKELYIGDKTKKLVDVVAFCLNPNHFHLILKQKTERGVEKFMKKVGSGYTQYFNKQNKRLGILFQGRFKFVHIDSNEYLLYLINYINLNNIIHNIPDTELSYSSWLEYTKDNPKNIMGNNQELCDKKIILEQFINKKYYEKEAKNMLPELIQQKKEGVGLERYFID